MGVSIVVGGQWGSEGKGKTTSYFTKHLSASTVVRVGGPNSGHTVIDDSGKRWVFQILPVSCIQKDVTSVLPAGSYIDLDILEREVKESGISENQLKIHPNAVVIDDIFKQSETNLLLNDRIGSTESGTGGAVQARVSRTSELSLARNEKRLEKYVSDTTTFLRDEIDQGNEVIIEGTQGFGLSLLHTHDYPFATSRDTSAAGFLSESGLSPLDVTNVIMVLRAFPIRVAGNSGPLPNELTWDDIGNLANTSVPPREYTTVTQRLRRVAHFDKNVVQQAITSNRPNIVVLNHCDYFDASLQNQTRLSSTAENAVRKIESVIGKIDFVGTGDRTLFGRP